MIDRPRTRPPLQRVAGGSKEDEAGELHAIPAEGACDARRIGLPAGYPAADIAERMGATEQAHRHRAATQFPLPHWDFVILDRRVDEGDHHWRLVSELERLGVV